MFICGGVIGRLPARLAHATRLHRPVRYVGTYIDEDLLASPRLSRAFSRFTSGARVPSLFPPFVSQSQRSRGETILLFCTASLSCHISYGIASTPAHVRDGWTSNGRGYVVYNRPRGVCILK